MLPRTGEKYADARGACAKGSELRRHRSSSRTSPVERKSEIYTPIRREDNARADQTVCAFGHCCGVERRPFVSCSGATRTVRTDHGRLSGGRVRTRCRESGQRAPRSIASNPSCRQRRKPRRDQSRSRRSIRTSLRRARRVIRILGSVAPDEKQRASKPPRLILRRRSLRPRQLNLRHLPGVPTSYSSSPTILRGIWCSTCRTSSRCRRTASRSTAIS
jgi:hypothetical protein